MSINSLCWCYAQTMYQKSDHVRPRFAKNYMSGPFRISTPVFSSQRKAFEQYFKVVLFIILYKVILTFKSVDEPQCVTIQMKAIEQYFHVVLYKVDLTSEFLDSVYKGVVFHAWE